jgi:hypothetical protein
MGASTTYRLSSLGYLGGGGEKGLLFDPSYIARLGASLGSLDLDLEFFQGLERQATLTGIMSTGVSGYTYKALLEPHRSRISALALAATLVVGPVRLWTEDSYSWGASLATGSAAWDFSGQDLIYFHPSVSFADNPITDTPPLLQRDKVAFTAGASYSPDLGGRLSLSAFAEATWSCFIEAPAGSPIPSLSRAAAGSLSLDGLAGSLGLSLSCLVSLADLSAALRPAASLRLGGDKALELACPLFFGAEDSELGCFSGRLFAIVAFSQKF